MPGTTIVAHLHRHQCFGGPDDLAEALFQQLLHRFGVSGKRGATGNSVLGIARCMRNFIVVERRRRLFEIGLAPPR